MTKRVGFLRAVNVGKRSVRMPQLVEICEELGYRGVRTYGNSGNVSFETAGSRSAIEHSMEVAFERAIGFELTTFVRSTAELRKMLQLHPFPVRDGDTYFITFLKTAASAATARALESASNDFDTLVVNGREVHWRMRGKSTDTTVKRKTWNLVGEHRSTSRNVTMLRKLEAKLGE
jgi:uncharacterized protein (DUF1697 family)